MHLRTALLLGRTVFTAQGSPRRLLTMDAAPRVVLGCVQPTEDVTMDATGPALMSRLSDVRLCLTKLPAEEGLQSAASKVFPKDSCDVLAYAGSGEGANTLKAAHPNAKVTDINTALVEALQHLTARRVALVTAYGKEAHEEMEGVLKAAGFEVVAGEHLDLASEAEASRVNRDALQEKLGDYRDTDVDTIVVGQGLPTCSPGYLDILEESIGKSVVTGQQALLWHMLRLGNIKEHLGGFGVLLRGPPAPPPVVPPFSKDYLEEAYPSRVREGEAKILDRTCPIVDRTYKYSGPLSPAELDKYERDGALHVRNVFSHAEISRMKAASDDLQRHYESLTFEELDAGGGHTLITEQAANDTGGVRPVLKTLWQAHLPEPYAPQLREYGSIFRRLITDSRIIDRVRQVLGTEAYMHQTRVNFQSKSGGGFGWHQDFEQWHNIDGLPRMRCVSVAMLLEPANHYNGALMVMPGTHKMMLQAYTEAEGFSSNSLKDGPQVPQDLFHEIAENHGIRYCIGQPGDIFMFDCNTYHGSHSNISPWGRCMVFGVYNSVENVCRSTPYGRDQVKIRPEHLGSHDPRYAGVPLPSLVQDLSL